MKTTQYFQYTRQRPDRIIILDEWIENTIHEPLREEIQADGRIRRWARIPDMENRVLRVILLEDGETVHNAFFDRNLRSKSCESNILKTQIPLWLSFPVTRPLRLRNSTRIFT
jgi:hypothetical protein